MSKRDVLLAIHNFSELKSLAKNAKIRSAQKFLLLGYEKIRLNGIEMAENKKMANSFLYTLLVIRFVQSCIHPLQKKRIIFLVVKRKVLVCRIHNHH